MNCPICQGRGYSFEDRQGYAVVVPCTCQNARRLQQSLQAAGIPRAYWNFTLQLKPKDHRQTLVAGGPAAARIHEPSLKEPFMKTKASQTTAIRRCRKLAEDLLAALLHGEKREVKGLLLYGPCGVGKTHLLGTLLTDLVYEGLSQVQFVDYAQLLRRLRFSYQSGGGGEQAVLEPLAGYKVLVLDDLGGETTENLAWVQDVLGFILTERQNRDLPTLITTNYPDEGQLPPVRGENARPNTYLVDRIGQRLRSRLYELCPLEVMSGLDLRPFLS
jgi:DNA replication protein DnaC